MDHAHLMAVQHGLQDLLNAMTACKHHGRPLVPAPGDGAAAEGEAGRGCAPAPACPAPRRPARGTTASGSAGGRPRRGAALRDTRRGGCLGFGGNLTPISFSMTIFKTKKFCH